MIDGNPNAPRRVLRIGPPPKLFIKAAVVGSRRPDVVPYDNINAQIDMLKSSFLKPYNRELRDSRYYAKVEDLTFEKFLWHATTNADDLVFIKALTDIFLRADRTAEALKILEKVATTLVLRDDLIKALVVYTKMQILRPEDQNILLIISEIKKALKLDESD